jgi:uncharacterized membrane protein
MIMIQRVSYYLWIVAGNLFMLQDQILEAKMQDVIVTNYKSLMKYVKP